MRILGPDGQPLSSNPQPSEEVRMAVEQAKALAQSGDLQNALQQMTFVFQQDIVSDLVIDTTISLLSQISQITGADAETPTVAPDGSPMPPTELQLFKAVQQDRQNVVAYYQLGNRFAQLGQPIMAYPFLNRTAELLKPMLPADLSQANQELVQLKQACDVDTAQVKMDMGDYSGALEAFHALNDVYGGLPIWLLMELAECYALLGQIDEADAVYELSTQEATAAFPGMEEVREEVGDLLARVRDYEDLTKLNLRAWHYIQTRAMLIESNPDENVPGERFVFWQPSEEDIAWVVGITAALLDAKELGPNRILWHGPSSEPLARLFAQWWEVDEVRAYVPGDNSEDSDVLSLLCMAHSYDIQDEETLMDLAVARPGMITFALDLRWTERQPLTPDIAGFMTQMCNLPWETRLQLSESESDPPTLIEETREPQQIAEEIAAQFAENAELDSAAKEVLDEYENCTDVILDHRDSSLMRRPLPLHSPIKSPRFGVI